MKEDERVTRLIARILQVEAVVVSDDLMYGAIRQWDSLAHVNLMLELESAYNIEIDEDTMIGLITVRAIKDYLSGVTS